MLLDNEVRIVFKILRNEKCALSKMNYRAYSPLLHPTKAERAAAWVNVNVLPTNRVQDGWVRDFVDYPNQAKQSRC